MTENGNRSRYSRRKLFADFYKDLLLIAVVNLALRVFYVYIELVARVMPIGDVPPDVQSYLPISVTRGFVTIADGVSILTFAIVAIGTLLRVVAVQFSSRKDE